MPKSSAPAYKPLTVLRLTKLWPHARKKGKEYGQIYRVGYYCKCGGPDLVWLVDRNGQYHWTADAPWIDKHFVVIKPSSERSIYRKNRKKIQPLTAREYRRFQAIH